MFASIFAFIHRFFASLKPWVVINPWEQALRVRLGKHVTPLVAGIHYRIPFMDVFFIQPIRLRIMTSDRQTLTTRDGRCVTLEGLIGFSISNLESLYRSLHQVDGTIRNLVKSEVADVVYRTDAVNLHPADLSTEVLNRVAFRLEQSGILIQSFGLCTFVVSDARGVRTIRLVGDYSPDTDSYHSRMDLTSESVSAMGAQRAGGPQ